MTSLMVIGQRKKRRNLGHSEPIDPFPKRHRLVHNGGFPKFKALYCGLNTVNSTESS